MTEVAWRRREDLSIDQHLAMRKAAVRVKSEFSEIYGAERIERFLHSSYDQFATGRTIPLDPHGLSAVRPIRDEIERRVRVLLDELAVPVSRG
jgi:hypothetical protein